MTNESTRPGTVLVTGASGLIGARICERLSSSYTVIGLDVDPPPDTLRHLEWLTCDLTRDESVSQALGTVRERHGDQLASVIHLAAYLRFLGSAQPVLSEADGRRHGPPAAHPTAVRCGAVRVLEQPPGHGTRRA
jgi:nucleoside-diphosphate-sugar epimerase